MKLGGGGGGISADVIKNTRRTGEKEEHVKQKGGK
jgi:hypothetical protein